MSCQELERDTAMINKFIQYAATCMYHIHALIIYHCSYHIVHCPSILFSNSYGCYTLNLDNPKTSIIKSNLLTMIDDYSRHRNLAACYQLARSISEIGSALAKRMGQGEVGGYTTPADCAWQLLQVTIERGWSVLDSLFFCLLVQTSAENGPFTL